jgi:hypothetical protein
MQKLLDLDGDKTMQFISESNRILQALQAAGEDAGKVFKSIRRFAHFVSESRGDRFKANIEKIRIRRKSRSSASSQPAAATPMCSMRRTGFILIDTGYAVYADEMQKTLSSLWPDFEVRPKKNLHNPRRCGPLRPFVQD